MNIPTAVIIPEGYTVRVIDNYAGDHDAVVVPGRYDLTPNYKIERAAWTRSGKDEQRFMDATASLTILEEERVAATALYFGKVLATEVRPAHEATHTFRLEPWHLDDLGRRFPALAFEFAAEEVSA